jgi:hypothetical protein
LKREGRTRSQKQEGKSGNQDKALETERQKQEPKVRRWSKSLKVSSLPSFCFYLLFSCVFCLPCVQEEEDDGTLDDGNVPSSSSMVVLQQKGNNNWCHLQSPFFLCLRRRRR